MEERRWAAFEERVDAELALGRHADLVSELEAAVAEQPLRERLHGQLMLALYRCGRQAEALEAFRRARRTLVEEIGVEPGAELRALQEAILAQDPALDAPPGPEELPAALDAGSADAGRPGPGAGGNWSRCWRTRARAVAAWCSCPARAASGRRAWLPSWLGRRCGGGCRVVYAGATTSPADALAAMRRVEQRERPALFVSTTPTMRAPSCSIGPAPRPR